MGWAKEQLMRQQELGYSSSGDKYVCSNCFGNDIIKKFIKRSKKENYCNYCNRKAKKPISTHLDKVIEFLLEGIYTEWEDPNDSVGWDDGWVGATVISGDELIYDYLWDDIDAQNDTLLDDIADSLRDGEWCRQNPYSLSQHEEDFIDWQHFCEMVKHKMRYVFYSEKIGEEDNYGEIKRPYQILDRLGQVVNQLGLIKEIEKGKIIYRVRQREKSESYKTVEKLGPPPLEFAKYANRMSPAGVVMFYGAFEKETALAETCQKVDKPIFVTISSFKLLTALRVLDLTALPTVPSLFDSKGRHLRNAIIFLRDFLRDIIKPIEKDGREHIEYVPTQIITEYFRFIFRDENGQSIQAISYPSSRKEDGIACVLFYDIENCTQDDRSDDLTDKTLCLITSTIEETEI